MEDFSDLSKEKDSLEIFDKKIEGILLENAEIKKQICLLQTAVNQQLTICDIKKNNSDSSKANGRSNDEDNHTLHVTTENDAETLKTESRNIEDKNTDYTSREDKSNWQKLAKSFIQLSSLHGLSRLTDSSLWVRILWVLAMAGAIAALIIQINGLTRDYLKYSVLTDVTLEQGPLTFPAVTVCNTRPYLAKKLLSLPLFANMSWKIDDPTRSFLSEKLLRSQHELTLEDLLYIGTNVSETLLVYTYPEERAKVRTIKYKGSCFTIEVPPGTEYMALLFNLHSNDSLSQFNLDPGIITLLKDNMNASFEYRHVHSILTIPGKQTYTQITHDVVNRLNESYGNCQDNEHAFTARTGITYEQDACHIECKFRNIISKCQCLFPWLQYFPLWPRDPKDALPICSIYPGSCVGNASKEPTTCVCKPRCHMKLYRQIMQSTSDLEKVDCDDFFRVLPLICILISKMIPANASEDWIKTNLAASIIHLSQQPYKTYTQRPEYPLLHFLADIGGTLGFYLGASMLTYFELVHLFVSMTLHLLQAIRRKKKKLSNRG